MRGGGRASGGIARKPIDLQILTSVKDNPNTHESQ